MYRLARCGSSGSSIDGGAGLIILGIAAVVSALAAAYAMAIDLAEISRELYNNQRVAANLAALAIFNF